MSVVLIAGWSPLPHQPWVRGVIVREAGGNCVHWGRVPEAVVSRVGAPAGFSMRVSVLWAEVSCDRKGVMCIPRSPARAGEGAARLTARACRCRSTPSVVLRHIVLVDVHIKRAKKDSPRVEDDGEGQEMGEHC